jgi:hypothetical protein
MKFYSDLAWRTNCKAMKTPLPARPNLKAHTEDADPEHQLLYHSMLGSIMHVMLWTRPDLAYTVSLLGQFSANPGLITGTA